MALTNHPHSHSFQPILVIPHGHIPTHRFTFFWILSGHILTQVDSNTIQSFCLPQHLPPEAVMMTRMMMKTLGAFPLTNVWAIPLFKLVLLDSKP
jgi:hypothetical protein